MCPAEKRTSQGAHRVADGFRTVFKKAFPEVVTRRLLPSPSGGRAVIV
jgi:hypothetical protein